MRALLCLIVAALLGCRDVPPPLLEPEPIAERLDQEDDAPEVTEVPEDTPVDAEELIGPAEEVIYAFSPEGSRLLLLAELRAQLVLLPEGRAVTLRTEGAELAIEGQSPSGFSREWVALGLQDGRVGVFGVDGRRHGAWRLPPKPGAMPAALAVSDSGHEVAAIYVDDDPSERKLRIWHGARHLDVPWVGLGWTRDFRFEASGQRLLVASPGAIETYRVADGRRLDRRLVAFDGVYGYASVSRDGRWVAEVTNGGHDLVAWPRRLTTGHQHVSAATGCLHHIGTGRFSPDGQRLVARHVDGSFVTYTVGSFRRWVGAVPTAGRALEVADDGRHYVDHPATGTGDAELRDGRGREPSVGLSPPARGYLVSPQGRYVVAREGGQVLLWRAKRGSAPMRFWP